MRAGTGPHRPSKQQLEKAADDERGIVTVTTEGLDPLDVTFGHRRLASSDVKDGRHMFERPAGTQRVDVCGLRRGRLAQRRILGDAIALDA